MKSELMTFSSKDEVRDFYKSYSENIGFGIPKLSGKNRVDGKQKYFSIGCAKCHNKVCRSKNVLNHRPWIKINFKTEINVVIQDNTNFVINGVHLEHNHILSIEKSRYFRSNKVFDLTTKRRLKLNNKIEIILNKKFQ